MSKIGIIGECMVEISGQPFSNLLTQSYGGDTLNTAVYLSRLLPKDDIYYITALGGDTMSENLCQFWKDENIKTDYTLRFEHLFPGLYWIVLDEKGERSFLYWRKNSAASQWLKHPNIESTLNDLMSMDCIYLSGISLAILDENDREKLFNWLHKYREQGGKIAYDSNYRPLLWEDRKIALNAHKKMLAMTDLALLTDDDEAAIWQLQKDELSKHLQQLEVPLLVLKQGNKGALVMPFNEESLLVPSLIIDKVVDSTAAGDSFNAGFISTYIQRLSYQEACENGHKLASTVIQHKGAVIPKAVMPIFLN